MREKTAAKYRDDFLPAAERAQDLLERMTLEEKLAQLGSYWVYQINDGVHLSRRKADELLSSGIGEITRVSGGSDMDPGQAAAFSNEVQRYLTEETRLGIPAIVHEEACSGFTAAGATIFPQAIGIAATFCPEISERIGETVRRQMRAAGAHQALAPLLDVTRDPRWGRTEETYGEDPYLVSRMGCSFIRGLQGNRSDGVLATAKHFVGYGASEGGMNWAPAHIPERELREVYLYPFEAAVRTQNLAAVMNGYHELDGVPCGANRHLLTEVLKEQWGFEGIVVSDYFAVNQLFDYHRMAADQKEAAKMALEAGIDVELPNVDCYGKPLREMVESGRIPMELVDESVKKVLTLKFSLGLFEHPFVDAARTEKVFDTAQDRALAREAAEKSLVLLENDGILPLSGKIRKLAVIGPCADSARNLLGDYTYQGQIEGLIELHESGKSEMNQPIPESIEESAAAVAADSLLSAIRREAPEGTQVLYERGCGIRDGDRSGFAEAVRIAEEADAVIFCAGDLSGITMACTAGESVDRTSLTLPGVQEDLIREVAKTGTPLIAVLTNGRPYDLSWEKERAAAVLEAWLPGEEGAGAVARALFGRLTPGGKLPITFPRNAGQIPAFYMHKKSGGRSHWRGDYDDCPASPLYPFGYGLSYTAFSLDGLCAPDRAAIGEGFDVSVTVENTGEREGDEVIQLYIRDEAASVTRPVKELKGFARVSLSPGEKKKVTFSLDTSQLGFYGMDLSYRVEPGEILIMAGTSSEEIACEKTILLTGEAACMEGKKKFETPVTVEPVG